ncbi:MAG: MoxR family ATPase [Blastocatellia bacterium]|nr:MoxR family ATPase [Blastocatellia bacterium]
MRPNHSDRPPENPRTFLLEQGEEPFAARLYEHGYRIRPRLMADVAEALVCHKPLLLIGPPGTGKTAIGFALAHAFNLNHYHIFCRKSHTPEQLICQWDDKLRAAVLEAEIKAGKPQEEVLPVLDTRPFLRLGEVAAGYDYTARTGHPCLIQIDELDKADAEGAVEDCLLEIMEAGSVYVPQLQPNPVVGLPSPQAEVWPVVLLTSNDSRKPISEPIRSRSLVHTIEPPKLQDELQIVRSVFAASGGLPHPGMLAQTVKIIQQLRQTPGLKQKPQVRELISLAKSFQARGVVEVTPADISTRLAHLAKTNTDRAVIERNLALLHLASLTPQPEIDQEVQTLCAR